MLRVYSGLKDRIMAGDFAPGERLDPKRLAAALLTSTSPVRDALHRLYGERLVDSWEQEGFRQPLISEAGVRDLYQWSAELMQLVLRSAASAEPQRATDPPPEGGGYASRIANCFNRIALRSPNHEHRVAVSNMVDRSALFRSVEESALLHPIQEVEAIDRAVAQSQWSAAASLLHQFHERRARLYLTIAAGLRKSSIG